MESYYIMPMFRFSTEFCVNQFSFCVILLSNKQTNADENITSLADIMMVIMMMINNNNNNNNTFQMLLVMLGRQSNSLSPAKK